MNNISNNILMINESQRPSPPATRPFFESTLIVLKKNLASGNGFEI